MTRPLSPAPSLSPEQLERFERLGVVRLEGLFSADGVRRAREAVLRRLAEAGVTQAGGWRLDDPESKLSAAIGGALAELDALGQEPALLAAVNALLGGRALDRRGQQRLRLLFSLPDPAGWTTPTGWHTDSPRLASGEGLGVQLFGFLDAVEPGGGGTLVVTGSHLILDERRFMKVKEIRGLLRRHPFFSRFYSDATSQGADRASLLAETNAVGDVALRVMELTGQPGDAYFTDLRIVHTGSPNTSDRPRMMVTRPFARADLMREVVEGFARG